MLSKDPSVQSGGARAGAVGRTSLSGFVNDTMRRESTPNANSSVSPLTATPTERYHKPTRGPMRSIKRLVFRILHRVGQFLHDAGVTLMFVGWRVEERPRPTTPTKNKTDPNPGFRLQPVTRFNWGLVIPVAIGWVVIIALIIYALTGCGGAPLETIDTVTAHPDDAGSPGADADSGLGNDADSAIIDAAPDNAAADITSSPETSTEAAPPNDDAAMGFALCCNRASGSLICADRPWYCCLGGRCTGGSANCGAVNGCRAGDPCGLVGGPIDSGTVGVCR